MKKILIGILIGAAIGGVIAFIAYASSKKQPSSPSSPALSSEPKDSQASSQHDQEASNNSSVFENKEIERSGVSSATNEKGLSGEASPKTEQTTPGSSSNRFWSIASKEYTLSQSGLTDFWKNAPGEVYKVCPTEKMVSCTQVVQYSGSIKDYVVEHYEYMMKTSNYTPTSEELKGIRQNAPAVMDEFDDNGIHWKRASWGNEFVGGLFTETSKGIIVIYITDQARGDGYGFDYEQAKKLGGVIQVE